jgi:hypothetical protein
MEDKMSLIYSQLNTCEEELKKEDKKLIRAEEEIQCLGHVLKLATSFKDKTKENAKHYVLKGPKNQKNQETKKVWVVKEKQVKEKEVEEVKMLSDNIKEHVLDLDKCSLHELINVLIIFANDPSFNVHQTGFGSYITNHVIKEKIQHYNNEATIPPKLGDVWMRKNLIAVGKESHHAILDLASSVNILSNNYMICVILTRN